MNFQKLKEASQKTGNWIKAHSQVLIGLAIFITSLVLIARSLNFIVNFIVFVVGLILLYYSLRILHLTEVTTVIDRCLTSLKNRFTR